MFGEQVLSVKINPWPSAYERYDDILEDLMIILRREVLLSHGLTCLLPLSCPPFLPFFQDVLLNTHTFMGICVFHLEIPQRMPEYHRRKKSLQRPLLRKRNIFLKVT